MYILRFGINYSFSNIIVTSVGKAKPHSASTAFKMPDGTGQVACLQYFLQTVYTSPSAKRSEYFSVSIDFS